MHTAATLQKFPRDIGQLLLNPGRFFEEQARQEDYGNALQFLLITCTLSTLLAGVFPAGRNGYLIAAAFLNALLMPILSATALYLATALLCPGRFTWKRLFCITAYAGVTVLVAWLPGVAWVSGLWNFYLIGVGLVRTGGIRARTALGCVGVVMATMVLGLQLLQPLWSG